jgi:hypothetical protein
MGALMLPTYSKVAGGEETLAKRQSVESSFWANRQSFGYLVEAREV